MRKELYYEKDCFDDMRSFSFCSLTCRMWIFSLVYKRSFFRIRGGIF